MSQKLWDEYDLWRYKSKEGVIARAEERAGILHKNGVKWNKAPLPRRLHRCKVQTHSPDVERCACGAVRFTDDPVWMQKNSRRTKR